MYSSAAHLSDSDTKIRLLTLNRQIYSQRLEEPSRLPWPQVSGEVVIIHLSEGVPLLRSLLRLYIFLYITLYFFYLLPFLHPSFRNCQGLLSSVQFPDILRQGYSSLVVLARSQTWHVQSVDLIIKSTGCICLDCPRRGTQGRDTTNTVDEPFALVE